MKKTDAKKEIRKLEKEVRKHQLLYYQKHAPIISDREYDLLFDRLVQLEKEFPDLASPNSPTQIVGSDLDNAFEKVKHTIPVLSLDNTYSMEETMKWANKFKPDSIFSLEWKIDGASLVLYYKKGELERVVSRGTGGEGDDITNNIKTVKNLPLVLEAPETVAVRGEVFMTFADFEKVNKKEGGRFANPRNLTSGTMKSKKSSQVAERPLRIMVYDAYWEKEKFQTHEEIMNYLQQIGLPTNPDIHFVALKNLEKAIEEKKQRRSKLEYPTDGMVLKLDSLREREALGHTRNSPRFAIALKLEQEEVATKIEAIEIFVGRTGKITPRAQVTPVEIAGTTVTYATLHNENYIQELGVGIGATVLISKRGEIIPAVEKVVFPGPSGTFKFPKNCPSCGTALVKDPEVADHFCPSPDCEEKKIARLQFFAGRKQMDITGLSDTTIETLYKMGYLKELLDFYHLKDRQKELSEVKGFGKRSVQLMIDGVEESKKRAFQYVLPSLGLKEIGQNVTELLIQNGYDSIEKIIQLAKSPDLEERFLVRKEIAGLGPKLVEMLRKHFSDPQVIKLIEVLKKEGLQMSATSVKTAVSSEFQGQSWCVTGSFEHFKPREKAMEEIERRGGKVVGSVSSKTTHLLAGENAGSKQSKAQEVGTKIISEAEFLKMIAPPAPESPAKEGAKPKSTTKEGAIPKSSAKKVAKPRSPAKSQKKLFEE